MNALDAFRLGDPATSLINQPVDARDESLLREILNTPVEPVDLRSESALAVLPRSRRHFDLRALLVTASVAIVIVAGTVVALQHAPAGPIGGGSRSPSPVPSRSASVRANLEAALFALLPAEADEGPALTWTDASRGATGAGFDATNKQIVLAGACEGGGAITVVVSGRADMHVDCTTTATVGPILIRAPSGQNEYAVDVTTAAGHPSYVVKTIAFNSKVAITFVDPAKTPVTSPATR